MNTFDLKVITPFGNKDIKNVDSLSINSDNGQMQFLANHIDLMCSVTSGDIVIKLNAKETTYIAKQGFIIFNNITNTAELVVNSFIEKGSIETVNKKDVITKIEKLLKENKSFDSFSIKYLENQKIGLEYEKDA